jgi:hypothetical protein
MQAPQGGFDSGSKRFTAWRFTPGEYEDFMSETRIGGIVKRGEWRLVSRGWKAVFQVLALQGRIDGGSKKVTA